MAATVLHSRTTLPSSPSQLWSVFQIPQPLSWGSLPPYSQISSMDPLISKSYDYSFLELVNTEHHLV